METRPVTPLKHSGGRRHVVALFDEITKKSVCQVIHSFFYNNELPTLDKILQKIQGRKDLPQICRLSLYKLMNLIKFKIGYETARRFAQEGAKVIICSRKQQNVDDALRTLHGEGLDVKGVLCHISKQEDRRNLLYEAEKLGGLDILFQNAGANPIPGPLIDCTESLWDKIFDTNLKSTFFLVKECLPLMKKRKGGSIILSSSIGAYAPHNKIGIYSCSKTALLGLTKTMANEFAEYNIRVNCVAPGFIDTKFANVLNTEPGLDKRFPMGRVGTPQQVSGVVAFLSSEDAGFITGETIVVAGGFHTRL